jgi:hypothetical protein
MRHGRATLDLRQGKTRFEGHGELRMKTAAALCNLDRIAPTATVDADIRSGIQSLLASYYPDGIVVERRRERRFPYPHPIHLTPIGDDDATPLAEPIVVIGKHLSEGGLGFFHQHPLACRRALVSLEEADGQWLGLIIDLTWCRFTRHGWYESGGRFVKAVPVVTPISRSRPREVRHPRAPA